jgi:hypothetical protein
MKKFKRATATYTGQSAALRHHCNPSNTDHMFRRGEPLELSEADAEHYAKKSDFDVKIEYFPKKAKTTKGKPKKDTPPPKEKKPEGKGGKK